MRYIHLECAEARELKLYLGNLPFEWGDAEIAALFEPLGVSVSIDLHRLGERSLGYAFVELDEIDADRVIEALNDRDVGGELPLIVERAQSSDVRSKNMKRLKW